MIYMNSKIENSINILIAFEIVFNTHVRVARAYLLVFKKREMKL
jgi:hypothetical protein